MKLFYTCPIIAAYMAKTFKVNFTTEENANLKFHRVNSACEWFFMENLSSYSQEDFYIRFDDLRLFEAIKGDLIKQRMSHDSGQGVTVDYVKLETSLEEYIEDCRHDYLSHEILQRQGKSFIMPEVVCQK